MKMVKMTRTGLAVILTLLLSAVLAACGDSATNTPTSGGVASPTSGGSAATTSASSGTATTAAASTGQKTTVTYMTWENNDTNAAIDQAMQSFMAANPDIQVQRLPSPNSDYGQKVNSMLQAKQLPDILWAGNDTEQQFASAGVLYDWTDLANSTKTDKFDLSKFAPASIDNWKGSDGKLYGLPTLMNTYGIWYNADLFQTAKLSLPTNKWTWEELYSDAKALTKKDGNNVTTYGFWGGDLVAAGTSPFFLSNCSVSAGGQPFEDKINNPTKVTADAQFIKCAKMLADAVQAGSVTPPGYGSGTGSAGIDSTSAFTSGKIPMLWGGQWLAPSFMKAKPTFKYGFAPLPTVNSQVQPYDAVGIISPKTIKNPQAVWKVMQFLAGGAWESVLVGAPVAPAAFVPSSQPYFKTLNDAGLTTVSDAVNYELQTPTKMGIRFTAPWASKANDILSKWNDVLNGKAPADSTIPQMVQQLNDLIKSSANS